MNSRHRMRVICAIVPLIAALASCSSAPSSQSGTASEPEFTGAYAQDYSQAYEQAKRNHSEFAVEALSDGELAESEVQESADRYVQCMADKGYTATKSIDGSGDVYHPDQPLDEAWTTRMERDMHDCDVQSGILYLSALWQQERTNPDGKNDTSMVIDCLRRHDVVDDSMSDVQIEQELNGGTDGAGGFSWIPYDMADPNYDADKAKWLQECQTNPRGF